MKVTNWRRTLAASLVACGLMSPAAYAADLNTNLIPDPQFDMLSGGTCCFNSFELSSWNDGTRLGFAYDNTISTYDAGGPLAGGGTHYFTSASSLEGDFMTMPGQVSENLDVSTGATATLIASGEAAVNLSAFFTSYGAGQSTHNTEGDVGFVHVDFLNAAATSLGTAQISRKQPIAIRWDQASGAFQVPVGTNTLKVSLFGAAATTSPDGYIDMVDVQVRERDDELLFLEVNTTNGQVAIKNQTGDTFALDFYEITSAGGALRANIWSSLQDQNLAGFPAGNGSGNGWEENARAGTDRLGESYLASNSAVANGANLGIGAAFNPAGSQDLVFKYGVVEAQVLSADFDGDGDADGADFLRWQRGLGTSGAGATKAVGNADGDADVDADDLAIWRNEFGSSAFGGPSRLVTGFVRYVTGATTAVPEPASVWLAGLGLACVAASGRRKAPCADSR